MKILVTGAAGFIGNALSLRLLERGKKHGYTETHNIDNQTTYNIGIS